jgi:hypothetical protein
MTEWLMPLARGCASVSGGWQFVDTFIGRDRPHAPGFALCVSLRDSCRQ